MTLLNREERKALVLAGLRRRAEVTVSVDHRLVTASFLGHDVHRAVQQPYLAVASIKTAEEEALDNLADELLRLHVAISRWMEGTD